MSALAVCYYSQKSAWIGKSIFSDWFHKHFVPLMKKYMVDKSLPPQHSFYNHYFSPTASTFLRFL